MTDQDKSDLDSLTIAAIAVVAYCAANVVHEGLGHGVACLLVGGRPLSFNAIFFACGDENVSTWGRVTVAAAGSIANVVFGVLAAQLLARWRPADTAMRYFLWLFCAVNLLTASGYLLFSGVGGLGDWADVVAPLGAPVVSRIAMTIVGAILYFVVVARILDRRLEPFLGTERKRRLGPLARLPYAVGGATFVLAGLFNPYGLELVLISAVAASFGGTSLLVWYPFGLRAGDTAQAPPAIPRSTGWLVAAVVTLVVFVGILGRGIGKPS
jgi:hypothetical protein